jgi:hypothetical protein
VVLGVSHHYDDALVVVMVFAITQTVTIGTFAHSPTRRRARAPSCRRWAGTG